MSPEIAQLIDLIRTQLDSQGKLLWAQFIILLLYTGATFAMAYFAWKQIKGYQEDRRAQAENQKKWKTIEACERLDTSEKFDDFNRAIVAKIIIGKEGYQDYSYDNMKPIAVDIKGLLNCLDALAIGVSERVYNEDIIRDHYEQTVNEAVKLFLLCEKDVRDGEKIIVDRPVVEKDGFDCLLKLYNRWQVESRKRGTHYCEKS